MANPEALSLIETWLAEVCPQTLAMKELHVVAKLAELSVWTYKDKGVAQCHPGRAFLASFVNWSVSKVSRFTGKLVKWGLITKVQPRIYDKATDTWQTLTTVYSLSFLTFPRIKELAKVLGITLAHMRSSFSKQEKKKKESCVQRPIQKAAAIVSDIARKVYERVMAMGKESEEVTVEIRTGNVARDAALNRFAQMGKGGVGTPPMSI